MESNIFSIIATKYRGVSWFTVFCGLIIIVFLSIFEEEPLNESAGYNVATVHNNAYSAPIEGAVVTAPLDDFELIIGNSAFRNVDLLLFPDNYVFFEKSKWNGSDIAGETEVPDPKLKLAPCDYPELYSYELTKISCIVRERQIYVVLNVNERVLVDNSSKLFSSVIAMDRGGNVVARYRKYNYLSGMFHDQPASLEPVSFHADFGVTFALLVQGDLMFQQPAADLLKLGVTNFLLSSSWTGLVPQGFSEQFNAGWAYARDVNLIVADTSLYERRSGIPDSGIYVGKSGPIPVIQFGIETANYNYEISKARVPVDRRNVDLGEALLYDETKAFTSQLFGSSDPCSFYKNLRGEDQDCGNLLINEIETTMPKLIRRKTKLCAGAVCCLFFATPNYEFLNKYKSSGFRYKYKFGMLSEKLVFANGTRMSIDLCSVDLKVRGSLAQSELTPIKTVRIFQRARNSDDKIFLPMVDRKLWKNNPASSSSWELNVSDEEFADLEVNLRDVGSAGLLVRRFDRDDNVTRSSGEVDDDLITVKLEKGLVSVEPTDEVAEDPRNWCSQSSYSCITKFLRHPVAYNSYIDYANQERFYGLLLIASILIVSFIYCVIFFYKRDVTMFIDVTL